MTEEGLPASARRFRERLLALGFDAPIVTFPESTRTAAEAAAAIGCTIAQIAKSLVFRTGTGGVPVLVVASGVNRVDEAAVARALAPRIAGDRVVRADAAFVRDTTGYAIGGVPPVGHDVPPVTAIDEDLLGHDTIWAAAGAPTAVFRLTPAELVRMTGGTVAAIARRG